MNEDEINISSELESLMDSEITSHSSDMLKSNLAQVQLKAEEAQKQQEVLMARNNEMRNKLNELRKRAEVDDNKLTANETDDDIISREIKLQAALQAERQQAALMRKALEERDKALEDLTNQCQSLEDDLEDRDREMDHLTRKIEQVKRDPSNSFEDEEHFNQLALATPQRTTARTRSEVDELFQPEPLQHKTFTLPWAKIGKIFGITLGVGIIGLIIIIISPHLYKAIVKFTSKPITTTTSSTPIIEPPVAITPNTTKAPPKVITAKPIPVNLVKIRDNLRSGGQGPLMVQIPAGKFFMGNKLLLGGGTDRDEQPHHLVTIKSFFMASYETTFEEYEQFARANAYSLPDDSGFGKGKRPIINVNWEEAQKYVQWLSAETGFNYYLPSESQWEYAARGNTTNRYWWGNSIQQGKAVCFACGTPWDNQSTAPVGSLNPNPFELYDTSGNVMEWLQDCYNINYDGAPNDNTPWLIGDCSQRIVRGGSFNKPMSATRNSARFRLPIESRFNTLGFRVARD
jgi:formylglycine-generating enzyme required for sulfatase activity